MAVAVAMIVRVTVRVSILEIAELAVAILHQLVVQQFVKYGFKNEGNLASELDITLVYALSRRVDNDVLRCRNRKGPGYFIRVLVNSAHFDCLL
jgi:hypothetical protein